MSEFGEFLTQLEKWVIGVLVTLAALCCAALVGYVLKVVA